MGGERGALWQTKWREYLQGSGVPGGDVSG
eukprot:COSAG01_NODE_32102_length_586_cov_1.209446_1_plen_30_part_01